MKKTTAEIANSDILGGNKPYLQRARLALPVLVRQAKAGQTIHYSDLAEEIDISNPRNLNYPLGAIGNALKELGSRTNKDIPPIQCIVINKDTDLPGEGIEGFIAKDYSKLPKTAKQNIVKHVLAKVFAFPYWDWVLEEFGLASVVADLSNEVEETKKLKGGGEGEHHKKFKAFVAQNPEVLRLGKNLKLEKIEYCLPSGDTVDVMFTKKDLRVAVEVKPATSGIEDILRGLFQCVKYKCLIEAEQIVKNQTPNSSVILALQGSLPNKLLGVRDVLGIMVVDNIQME